MSFSKLATDPSQASAEWKALAVAPDYSKELFDGVTRYFTSFRQYFRQHLGEKSLGNLLSPEFRPQVEELIQPTVWIPEVAIPLPDGTMNVLAAHFAPLNEAERRFNTKMREVNGKIVSKYQAALSLLDLRLGPNAKSVIAPFTRDTSRTVDANFFLAMEALDTKYGSTPEITSAELRNTASTCPRVETVSDAFAFFSMINGVALDVAVLTPENPLGDSFIRTLILQKFGSVFQYLTESMCGTGCADAWSFENICTYVKSMQDRDRLRNVVVPHSSSVSSPSPVITTDVTAAPSLINSVTGSGGGASAGCKNCGNVAHSIRLCDQMCKLCSNPSVPRPHHALDCPEFLRARALRASSNGGGRSGSNASGRGSGRGGGGGGRGYGGRGDGRDSRGGGASKRPGPPAENLYNQVKQRRTVNEVRSDVLYSDFDVGTDGLDMYDLEDYSDDDDDFAPCFRSNAMAIAIAPVAWFPASVVESMLLERMLCVSAARGVGVLSPLTKFYFAQLLQPFVLQLQILRHSAVKSPFSAFFLPALRWERYCPSYNSALRPLTERRWLDAEGVQEIAAELKRRRRLSKGVPRGSPRSSVSVCARVSTSPCEVSRRVTRSRPLLVSFAPRRGYLQQCQFYRSSLKGRGRDYSPPWWSTPTSSVSAVPLVSLSGSDSAARERSGESVCGLGSDTRCSDQEEDVSCRGGSKGCSPLLSLFCRFRGLSPGVSFFSGSYASPLRLVPALCCTHSISPVESSVPRALDLAIGMLDTGANLSISHPRLATLLQLQPIPWKSPVPIRFGNSTDAISTHYVNLGRFLGRVALVESASSTILTKRALHAQGISVLFGSDGRCSLLLDSDRSVVYETQLVNPDDFFMLPLVALLPPSLAAVLAEVLQQSVSPAVPPSSPTPVPIAVVNGRRSLPMVTEAEVQAVMSLHERMYHPSAATMARALRAGAWLGVTLSPTLVERVFSHRDCLYCALGKMKRVPRPVGSSIVPRFGHEVSVDYVPVTTPALGGFTGAYIFVERASGYAWAYLLKESTKARLLYKAICYVRSSLLRYQHQLRAVRTDAGRVEVSAGLAEQLAEFNIVLNAASPSAQYQNFVERFIQTAIHGIATSLLAQPHLDNSFWALALQAWVGAWHSRLNSSSESESPLFAMTGRHPDLSVRFQHAFGAPVSSRTLESRTRPFKFSPSGELGFVVGNTESVNGASLVFFPAKSTTQVFPRVDLQVLKLPSTPVTRVDLGRHLDNLTIDPVGVTLPVVPRMSAPLVPSTAFSTPDPSLPLLSEEVAVSVSDLVHADSAREVLHPAAVSVPDVSVLAPPPLSDDSPVTGPPPTVVSTGDPPTVLAPAVEVVSAAQDEEISVAELSPASDEVLVDDSPAMSTRSKRSINLVTDGTASASPSPPPADREVLSDTPTVTQALKSSRAADWRGAIKVELTALLNHGTGEEVALSHVPRGAQILPVKIVLKLKRDSEGVPTKFKARLVVLGNLQKTVPSNVFSPTANDKSLKLLLAVATGLRLPLLSLDVYGAFLYPTQSEEVFITIPPIITGGESVIWKLQKTMYGLAASPRAFYDHVSDHLLVCGYQRCASDPCFFWFRSGDGFLLAVVHVDDFVVAASNEAMLARFVRHMEQVYVVLVTPDVQHFLGLHTQDFPCGARLMSQPGLLRKLFDKHPDIAALTRMPSVPMSSLFNDAAQEESPACDRKSYMELLGSLLYVVKTRPDISFAVNRLSMRSTVATEADFRALRRVLAYLYATRHRGVTLRPMLRSDVRLEAWCDASYALHHDGRSQSGYAFTLATSQSGMFYSRSSKQTNVTLSSTEAELYAAVEATKDIIWFRGLLAEIGFPQVAPTTMFVDNASMMVLASSYSGNHKRVKHFLVRLNFLIEAVSDGILHMEKVDTLLNLSDTLTKALGPIDFHPKSEALLGSPPVGSPV